MNGADFFMQHCGYRLLPQHLRSGDAVADARALFGYSLLLHGAKKDDSRLRMSSSWWVITPRLVETSFKVLPTQHIVVSTRKRPEAILDALKRCAEHDEPCMLLALGKRRLDASDLFVSYDPRRARLCSEGSVKTYDATLAKDWSIK